MSTWVVGWVALMVGAGALGRFRLRKALATVFHQKRMMFEQPWTFREIGDDDRRLFVHAAEVENALAACGFATVGDVGVHVGTYGLQTIYRVMVDRTGTCSAWIAVPVSHPRHHALFLRSFSDDRAHTTMRVAFAGSFAAPPHHSRVFVARTMRSAQVFAAHRPVMPAASLVKLVTREELVAQLARDHERTMAWRRSEPTDRLFDADLRAFLGDRFKRHRATVERSVSTPPTAVARHRD